MKQYLNEPNLTRINIKYEQNLKHKHNFKRYLLNTKRPLKSETYLIRDTNKHETRLKIRNEN